MSKQGLLLSMSMATGALMSPRQGERCAPHERRHCADERPNPRVDYRHLFQRRVDARVETNVGCAQKRRGAVGLHVEAAEAHRGADPGKGQGVAAGEEAGRQRPPLRALHEPILLHFVHLR